jgi:hemoglobin
MNESGSGAARTPYEMIGGEHAVRQLVDRFYDLMDTEPEAAGIRALHPPTLDSSREKLRLFLTGWLGGPQLYVERYGHPRLRARHLPFPIGEGERDAWVRCMHQALDEQEMPEQVRVFLRERFRGVADHMRNQAPRRGDGS